MKKKIVIFANSYFTFKNHRYSLAKELSLKYKLTVILPYENATKQVEDINNSFDIININLNRKSLNPLSNLKILYDVHKILKDTAPDIIHNFTVKCVIWGSLASLPMRKIKIINSITGLGFAFSGFSFKQILSKSMILFFYKLISFNKNVRFIFQNLSDLTIINAALKMPRSQFLLIPGSGVNINSYKVEDKSYSTEKPFKLLFASRLLKDKGLWELINAIRVVNKKEVSVKLIIAGDIDVGNPNSLSTKDLNYISKVPNIKLIGHLENISTELKNADIFILPSYREGLSKVIMEAMCANLPIITTNVPGCKELVDIGTNGYLSKVQDYKDLAIQIEKMITQDLHKMGQNSFKKVQNYSTKEINQKIVDVYEN